MKKLNLAIRILIMYKDISFMNIMMNSLIVIKTKKLIRFIVIVKIAILKDLVMKNF